MCEILITSLSKTFGPASVAAHTCNPRAIFVCEGRPMARTPSHGTLNALTVSACIGNAGFKACPSHLLPKRHTWRLTYPLRCCRDSRSPQGYFARAARMVTCLRTPVGLATTSMVMVSKLPQEEVRFLSLAFAVLRLGRVLVGQLFLFSFSPDPTTCKRVRFPLAALIG